jgi:hypothetical protein
MSHFRIILDHIIDLYITLFHLLVQICRENPWIPDTITPDTRKDIGLRFFLGEEDSAASGGEGVRRIVDPIDGTVNYFHDHPMFVVSIAFEKADAITAGLGTPPI